CWAHNEPGGEQAARIDRAGSDHYFGGFSCFHGSLTIGIVAISILTSLPSCFSTRRIYTFWTMSRVSGSIMIGPRGLSRFFPPFKNAIASSAVNFPCVALTRSKTATIPSQALTDRKLGIAVSAYSRFQAARRASFAGRLPAVE